MPDLRIQILEHIVSGGIGHIVLHTQCNLRNGSLHSFAPDLLQRPKGSSYRPHSVRSSNRLVASWSRAMSGNVAGNVTVRNVAVGNVAGNERANCQLTQMHQRSIAIPLPVNIFHVL